MKLFSWGKDGGPESHVWGFYVIEIKKLFSVVLLRFEDGSREAFHNHAFNAVSWLLTGSLHELLANHSAVRTYKPSFSPIVTRRTTFHQVRSRGRSWAITFRGPWRKTWEEYLPEIERYITLKHGRKVV